MPNGMGENPNPLGVGGCQPVLLDPKEVTARGGMYFIIRLDSAGQPTQLEYTIKPTRLDHVRVINRE